MVTTTDKREEAEVGSTVLVSMIAAVTIAFGLYWYFLVRSVAPDGRGQFGDMFGGFNALFTAFAFAGLIYSSFLQRHELGPQRLELKATRDELRGQKEQLSEQREVASQQLFENTLFKMMSLHHQIVGAIEMPARQPQLEKNGRYAFELFLGDLRGRYQSEPRKDPRSLDGLNELDDIYLQSFAKYERSFGHYFRNLYHIFKFIDRHPAVDRYYYATLVRAQLSTDELCCLFYNCLSQQGVEKFKPLAERYALFKNLNWKHLLHEQHCSYFESGALFGRSGEDEGAV